MELSTIFLSCKVFHDWSIIKLGNILYLLDGYIFAVLFETTSHCFLLIKFTGEAKKNRTLHSGIFQRQLSIIKFIQRQLSIIKFTLNYQPIRNNLTSASVLSMLIEMDYLNYPPIRNNLSSASLPLSCAGVILKILNSI